jgi:hypothetical protein
MAEIDLETKQTLSHRGRASAPLPRRMCDKDPRKGDGETRKPHESPVSPERELPRTWSEQSWANTLLKRLHRALRMHIYSVTDTPWFKGGIL